MGTADPFELDVFDFDTVTATGDIRVARPEPGAVLFYCGSTVVGSLEVLSMTEP